MLNIDSRGYDPTIKSNEIEEKGFLGENSLEIIFDEDNGDFFYNPNEISKKIEYSSNKDLFKKLHVKTVCTDPSCEKMGEENVYMDSNRGELICASCGGVINDHSFDKRGVRVYDQSDIDSKVHYEPMSPTNRPMIKVTTNDIDAKRRANRNNRTDWKYKKIITMQIEFAKLRSVIHVPRNIEMFAMEKIKSVFDTGVLRGRFAFPMALAILYQTCLEENAPVKLKDILNCYGSKRLRKSIRTSVRILSSDERFKDKFKFVPKSDYSRMITRYCSDLDLPAHICTEVITLMRKVKNNVSFSGSPNGYIGACLYIVSNKYTEYKRTQKQVASVVEMTEVTLRRRTKEVGTVTDGNQEIPPSSI